MMQVSSLDAMNCALAGFCFCDNLEDAIFDYATFKGRSDRLSEDSFLPSRGELLFHHDSRYFHIFVCRWLSLRQLIFNHNHNLNFWFQHARKITTTWSNEIPLIPKWILK